MAGSQTDGYLDSGGMSDRLNRVESIQDTTNGTFAGPDHCLATAVIIKWVLPVLSATSSGNSSNRANIMFPRLAATMSTLVIADGLKNW